MRTGCVIFRVIIAVERSLKGWKLDYDVAGARLALGGMKLASAHKELCSIPFEDRCGTGDIGLVGFGIVYVDPRDPVRFLHAVSSKKNTAGRYVCAMPRGLQIEGHR